MDADYANKANNRRSVSGTVDTLGGAAVSWESITQRCVTLPLAEAEHAPLNKPPALFRGAVFIVYVPRTKRTVRAGVRG